MDSGGHQCSPMRGCPLAEGLDRSYSSRTPIHSAWSRAREQGLTLNRHIDPPAGLRDRTLQGQCLPNPLRQSPWRPPGPRTPLMLCVGGEERGLGQKNSIPWNPGPRSLEKPECNSHRGFHHSGEATGNLAWQPCSRADSDCLGWEEIRTD